MVNILNEDYESIILGENYDNDSDHPKKQAKQQIVSHFTGIDPDGKGFMSLSGCKDKECYKKIVNVSEICETQDTRYVKKDGIMYYAPNRYFTLSTEEKGNKQIFNIGRDNPYIEGSYIEFKEHGESTTDQLEFHSYLKRNNYELLGPQEEGDDIYQGIKDENSVFRIEEENGKADVFITGDLHISGDFLVNGQNASLGGGSVVGSQVVSNTNIFNNTIEINAAKHKNKKNVDSGFISKRFQRESEKMTVDENFVIDNGNKTIDDLATINNINEFNNFKSQTLYPSNSSIDFISQKSAALAIDNFYVVVIPGDSILPSEIQENPDDDIDNSGYTRNELGRDMVKVYDGDFNEYRVYFSNVADNKHNQNGGKYQVKGWTPINLENGNAVYSSDGTTELFTMKLSKDLGHSENFDTDATEDFSSSKLKGIEIYKISSSFIPTSLSQLNELGDVVNIKEEEDSLWSFNRATTADAFIYSKDAVAINSNNKLGISIPDNSKINIKVVDTLIPSSENLDLQTSDGDCSKKMLSFNTDVTKLLNNILGWYLVICYNESGNTKYQVRHITSANTGIENNVVCLSLGFCELSEVPTEVYGWGLFSKTHTGLIFDEGDNSFALSYLQKDGCNNLLQCNNKAITNPTLKDLDNNCFVPLYTGPVHMKINDDETVPTLSGSDYTIDLHGSASDGDCTFHVDAKGQVCIESKEYSDDAVKIKSYQGSILIDALNDIKYHTGTDGKFLFKSYGSFVDIDTEDDGANIKFGHSSGSIEIGNVAQTNNIKLNSVSSKVEVTNIHHIDSLKQIHLQTSTNAYSGNDGILIETASSGIKNISGQDYSIQASGDISIDGTTSNISMGPTTTADIKIGSHSAQTTTIKSERIELTAASQSQQSNGVVLIDGTIEENVHIGKSIDLKQNDNSYATFKIKANSTDLITVTPTDNGDSCTMEVNGPILNVSDGLMKKNIETLDNVTDKLREIRGVRFQYRDETPFDSDMVHLGIIAQEVEKVFPELVVDSSNGYKTMNYVSLTAVLLQALKEQQNQIDELKNILNDN